MYKLEASLVLVCNGASFGDFTFCSGTSNVIVRVKDLDDHTYERYMFFLEKSTGLFDGIMYDRNKVSNTLNLSYKPYDAYNKEVLENIQSFIFMHKSCGLSLMLCLDEDLTE